VRAPDGSLQALLAPRAVAVIGATERQGASAFYVMRNLSENGYAGRILPVNPKGGTIFGRPAAPSIAALSERPDVAVICIAAAQVNAALEEAGRAGIKAAVVLASGFAETGAEGQARQHELAAIAQRYGMAVCGPNCLGLFNLHTGAALYSSTLVQGMRKGALALVSHSGATALTLSNCGRLGHSVIVSAGNGAVTDVPDYLLWLAQHEATRVIGVVLESIRDPAAFRVAMAAVQDAGKSVIALRVGRSDAGQRATVAHTGALAGSSDAYASLFRQTGVVEVSDMDEFVETAALFTELRSRPKRRGVAVIGVSGGGVAHVSDIAEENGIDLPAFSSQTVARLVAILPDFATAQNPLDTTGIVFADASVYSRVLDAVAADPGTGLIVAAQDAPPGLDDRTSGEYFGIVGAVAEFSRAGAVPTVLISNLSAGHHPAILGCINGSVPVLNGTRSALRAISHVLPRRGPVLDRMPPPGLPPDARWLARLVPGAVLTEREAKHFLADHHLPVTRETFAATAAEAVVAAEAIGYPVVLKIESPDLPHKTEAGGIRLNLRDDAAVRSAFEAVIASARRFAPTADLRGVVVQEMVTGGVEAIVGISRHEPFGPGMVVGLGGVLVELIDDAAFELLPISHDLARDMVGRTRLGRLLAGYRGAPAADVPALCNLIVGLSRLINSYGDRIDAIDLNPVSVLPQGRGLRILDALILTRR